MDEEAVVSLSVDIFGSAVVPAAQTDMGLHTQRSHLQGIPTLNVPFDH